MNKAVNFFHSRPGVIAAASLILLLTAAAALAPLLAPRDPNAVDLEKINRPPAREHWFGTDDKGRDVFSRVLHGARVSLGIGLAATALALAIGTTAGLLGGYFGGALDHALQVVVDITLAFPSLLLAIGITVVLRPGFFTVFLALALAGWASLARLVRGEVIALKQREYVLAARSVGASPSRIIRRHILPNCLPILLVASSLKVGGFILGEAALSFLDLGVRPPAATWGFMISAGREYLRSAPWMTVFPGLALAATVLAFNLLGDALRDHLDPKLEVR